MYSFIVTSTLTDNLTLSGYKIMNWDKSYHSEVILNFNAAENEN